MFVASSSDPLPSLFMPLGSKNGTAEVTRFNFASLTHRWQSHPGRVHCLVLDQPRKTGNPDLTEKILTGM